MKIAEERQSGVLVLKPEGRLDSATSPAFEAVLLQAIESGDGKIVVDLAAVSYMSSRGLRVFLLGAKKMAAAEGKLAVCALQPFVREVFETVGFHEVVPVFDDSAKAVASLAGGESC